VIQEAFFHGRPILSSNIGGMAEKIVDEVNGLHFRSGSPEDLADCMTRALSEPGSLAAPARRHHAAADPCRMRRPASSRSISA
jgi:glycosyltransferase involved in cell wall biosynthesis